MTTIPITSQAKFAAAQAEAKKAAEKLAVSPLSSPKTNGSVVNNQATKPVQKDKFVTSKPSVQALPKPAAINKTVNGGSVKPLSPKGPGSGVIKPIAAKPSPPKTSPLSPKGSVAGTAAPMVPTTTAFALGATQQALIAAQCITAAANGRAPLTAAAMESLPHFAAAQAAALSQAAAAAVVEQQKAAMQSMFRLPLGQSAGRPSAAASALMSPTGTGYNTSTPPNNRLQLKVKTTSPTAPAPQGNLPFSI